jgi:hypothetical protein
MDNLAESPHEQLQRARCQAAEYRISQRPGVYDDERSSSNSGQTADEEDVDEDDSTCGAATDAKTELTPPFWSKHLSVILAGTRDSGSPWHLFNGYEDVLVKDIYTRMVATSRRYNISSQRRGTSRQL